MADEDIAAESKFLAKNYHAYLYDFWNEVKHGKGDVHISPPPAFRHIYDLIINHTVDFRNEELNYRDLIYMMDQVAKFVSYLNRNGIEYDEFTESPSTRLSADDLNRLLTSGGDNR